MGIKAEKNQCWECIYFPLPEALAAGGHGYCKRMEQARGQDFPATVLFKKAQDITARVALLNNFIETTKPENKENG